VVKFRARPPRPWWPALAVLAAVALSAPAPRAQGVEEYAVKAAFLFNFVRFTEWPPAAFPNDRAPLVLCIVGTDPFGAALDSLEKKPVKGRELHVDRKVTPGTLNKCHVAFISRSRSGNVREVLKTAEALTVLTVSDIDEFARKGGIIGLVTDGGKIRFQINVKAAERVGLKLSSQLLKLASIVEG
jgi:hypothetical protein